ncbi:intein-containing RctB family protein [Thermodesulfovibrio sp. 1176]|uniref:intein-containing RctB family protein n=1 Tax=Thermodesulfovibrio sp. 1176 TaxID=3043424 RepID=UPI002482CC92|nr:intein-containing RctB family protein [Thermodesulfovibrio sp. 1176]MDI1471973.1 intein-containing RctB family protein [Thermodesulfovibrio sp. 1176]
MPKIEGTIRLDPYRIQVPKGFVQGMKTEGIIYLDEVLESDLELDSVRQVANVATLPGIVGKSLAMPDIHTGYGFPIGGVAAFDAEEGVISPGGVGYDINCLSPDSKILTEHGYWIRIKNIPEKFKGERLKLYNLSEGHNDSSEILLATKRFVKEQESVIKIYTEMGKEIEGSFDHPVLTPHGYMNLADLKENDYVIIYPFEGVEYEEKEGILLDEKIFSDKNPQIIKYLKKRDLLPLKWNDHRLGILSRIFGFALGDGHLGKMQGRISLSFYGKEENLRELKKDLDKLGISSNIHIRQKKYSIETVSGKYTGKTESAELRISSRAFAVLLQNLGLPLGKKTELSYRIPDWIKQAPLWIKRNFLAGFFGADGSILTFKSCTPLPVNITQTKKKELKQNLMDFLYDIANILKEFGINSVIYKIKSKQNITYRLSIVGEENIRIFAGKINYEYDLKKKQQALFAYAYLKKKKKVKEVRQNALTKAILSYRDSKSLKKAYESVSDIVNKRFVERVIYSDIKEVRIPEKFMDFKEYINNFGLNGGFVKDRIIKIEQNIPNYSHLYDLGVRHHAHNFIANGIVVHNCGVRLLKSNLTKEEVEPKIRELIDLLYTHIPSGVGSTGKIKLSPEDAKKVVRKGAIWAVEQGYGEADDLQKIESNGCLEGADPEVISKKAYERGKDQLGTLGSGNHFLEVQYVDEVYEPEIAETMGLFKNQITVMIHSGSRGFGHQICDDYVREMLQAAKKYGIELPDKELACAPFRSKEGQKYFAAMKGAANYAWANRQCLMHWTREVFLRLFKLSPKDLAMTVVFDVAHNIAKEEIHTVNGKKVRLVVHRKGATRAFPKGHPELPQVYFNIGQPVIIPGDMGRVSFVLVGEERAMQETFGSTCHGAGRLLSRTQAIKQAKGRSIKEEMAQKGIIVRSAGKETLAEEMPDAYKDVSNVVDVVHNAGIARKVVKLRPLGVIKG